MNKLKIGFVLDDTLDTSDGVQQYVLTLGAWLSSKGHDIHYLVGQTERTDIPAVHSLSRNIGVQFNGNRMSTPLPASRKVIRGLLENEQFDILHVQMPYSPFMAARIVAMAPKKTAIFGTFHIAPHSTVVSMGNRVLGALLKPSLKRFEKVFAVSDAAADFARQTYGIQADILPNVVKASQYQSAAPFETTSEAKVSIVFLGRLVPRKGCHILLQALNMLNSTGELDGVQVNICGKGPLMADLQKYAQTHGLSQHVAFVGYVDETTKARYLKTADIAVFPSTGGESFGIVLLEAMAAEHPVVLGADNEGYKTVLKPYPEALFRANDPASLADSLRRNLVSDGRRQQALRWQKDYIKQFDVDIVGRRLTARYEEVLRSRANVR